MELLIPVLVGLAAVVLVFAPLLRRATPSVNAEALDVEVERFRAALRADTLCARCSEPNPAGSRFCARCGRRLTPTA